MSAKAGKDVKVAMPPVCLLEIEGEVRFKGNIKECQNYLLGARER